MIAIKAWADILTKVPNSKPINSKNFYNNGKTVGNFIQNLKTMEFQAGLDFYYKTPPWIL